MSLITGNKKGFARDRQAKCPLSSTRTEVTLCIESSCPGFAGEANSCYYRQAANLGLSIIYGETKPTKSPTFDQDFQTIFTENYQRVLNIALRMLRNREAAEDIAQEVFVRAYNHAHELRAGVPISAWLYRVATNLCLDELRKQRQIKVDCCADIDMDEIQKRFKNCWDSDPELAFSEKEEATILDKTLQSLPPNYCQVLIMKCIEGLSYEDIGLSMDCTVASVRSTIFRARKQFVEHYSRLRKEAGQAE